jgi:CHAT domain-containing protein
MHHYLAPYFALFLSGFATFIPQNLPGQQDAAQDAALYHYNQARQSREDRDIQNAHHHARIADSLLHLHNAADSRTAAEVKYLKGLMAYNRGALQEAIADLSAARALFERHESPGRVADCLLWLGNTYWYAQGPQAAYNHFVEAAQAAEMDELQEREYRGKYYSDQGYALLELSDFAKGRRLIEEGLRRDTAHYGRYHKNSAAAFHVLAVLHIYNEDYYQALNAFQAVEDIYTVLFTDDTAIDFAVLYGSMGKAWFNLNRFYQALDYSHKALSIFQKHLRPDHPNLLLCYTSIGETYYNIGELEQGYQYYMKAGELNTGIDPIKEIAVLQGQAFYYQYRKDFVKADSFFRLALPLVERLLGGGKPLAHLYEQLGEVATELKNTDEAIRLLQQSAALYAEVLGVKSPALARVYVRMAEAYSTELRWDSVAYYAESGLDIIWNDHQDFSRISAPDVWYLLTDYKGMALMKGRPLDDYVSQKKALECYLLADRYFDYLRSRSERPEDKGVLGNSVSDMHFKTIISCHTLQAIDPQLLHQAFRSSEKDKGRQLLEAMYMARIPELEGYMTGTKDIQKRIDYYEQKIYENGQNNRTDEVTLNEWKGILFDLRKQLSDFKRKATKSPLVSSIENAPDRYITVEELRRELLRPDEALLEYVVGKQGIYIFLITKDTFVVHEIRAKKDMPLSTLVEQLRTGLYGYHTPTTDSVSMLYEYMAQQYIQAAHQLYDLLLAPVQPLLPKRLFIVPDGVLGYVPFEALLMQAPSNPRKFQSHSYFGKEHIISYAYSATLLREMRQKQHRKTPSGSVLAMAPFFFGNAKKTAQSIHPADPLLELASRGDALDTLRFSGEEVLRIAKAYKGKALIDADATKAAFLAQAADYRYLHLSTHGVADDRVGDYAYLSFCVPGQKHLNEKLYVRDIYNLSLNADLVVLSACEAGIGQLQRGEGIISLSRAFAYAGAKGIVTTLWSVNDESTKDFMLAFYRHLQKMPRAEALHQARLEFLNKRTGEQAHPYYWAGFIGVGDM